MGNTNQKERLMNILKASILAAIFGLSAAQANACSCGQEASVQQQAERYELIFVGTPTETINPDAAPPAKRSFWKRLQFWKPAPAPQEVEFSPHTQLETRFENSTILKGTPASPLIIKHSEPDGANCGRSFSPERTYFILAYKHEDGTYSTSICAMPQFSRADFEAVLAKAD